MANNQDSTNLNKFISATGICSRREAEKLIIEGRVTINGIPTKLGNRVVEGDDVRIDGKPLRPKPKTRYIALNKPIGIVCTTDSKERKNIVKNLKEDGKQVIGITEAQVHNFAGNMLQVRGANDERFLVMSQAAYASLTPQQIAKIENHCKIISSSLDTIEACGGGSARCMMAEVFLPKA